ncbi:MAG: methyltransferase domain-containing protein [Pseudanabaenales cyanobacterium]|nr:methyltransferase domain-containing protein [Pseudanabaenales cyanobacterium]
MATDTAALPDDIRESIAIGDAKSRAGQPPIADDILTSKTRFFDRWAPTYDWLLPSVFYQAVHKRLLEYIQLSEQAHVLDIGCGTGRLLDRLAKRFPHLQGIGLDLSPEMLRQARRNNHYRPRLIFIQGVSHAMPFVENQFEAAFNTISFLHYPDPQRVLQEVHRVLQPGGRFYLVDYTLSEWRSGMQQRLFSPIRIRFYSRQTRERMGTEAGLRCAGHHHLLGPVLLTIFVKAQS